MNTWASAVSFYTLKHLALSFNHATVKPPFSIITFGIVALRFSSYRRQPFSKQLYQRFIRWIALSSLRRIGPLHDLVTWHNITHAGQQVTLHSGTTYIHLHTYISLCFKVNSTIYNIPAGSKAILGGSCLQELYTTKGNKRT